MYHPHNACRKEVLKVPLCSLPIIDQTGTYVYKASKVVAKYLGPKNDYRIRDTLSFPDLLKRAPSDEI